MHGNLSYVHDHEHLGRHNTPVHQRMQHAEMCTKAALRDQQRVVFRTEPGVLETCQVRPKCPKKKRLMGRENDLHRFDFLSG